MARDLQGLGRRVTQNRLLSCEIPPDPMPILGGACPAVATPRRLKVARFPSAGRTAARNLCNISLRTASGPEGSSAKQTLTCAAGPPGRGGARGQPSRSASSHLRHPSHPCPTRSSPASGARSASTTWSASRRVTRTLRNAITSGRIAQAFVFAGPRGVRQDDDRAHPGARAQLRERADRRSVRRVRRLRRDRRRAATSTSSRSTPPRTPASTTSAR